MMTEDRKQFHEDEFKQFSDGRWYWVPSDRVRCCSSFNLRAIASELDRRNGIVQQSMEQFDYKP